MSRHRPPHPLGAGATRSETMRYVREEAGGVAAYVLAEIALDERQPAGARAAAGKELARMAGIATNDSGEAKELHEMNGEELAQYRRRLAARLEAIERAKADWARPVIDAATETVFD